MEVLRRIAAPILDIGTRLDEKARLKYYDAFVSEFAYIAFPFSSSKVIRYGPRCRPHECFQLYAQQTNVYCAVATGQMILDFYRRYFTQDQIAAAMGTDSGGTSNPGQVAGYESLSNNCLDATYDTSAAWSEAKSEIDANRPLKSEHPGPRARVRRLDEDVVLELVLLRPVAEDLRSVALERRHLCRRRGRVGGLGRGDAHQLHLRPPRLSDVRATARERAQQLARQDALFASWPRRSSASQCSSTTSGAPSYWLVPVERVDRAIGFVRVNLDGRASAAGALYRDPERLDEAPRVVTWITADEAQGRAASEAAPGAVIDDPVYVHDGPPGREAWLVRAQQSDGSSRWLFVTAAGWYEHQHMGDR